MMKKSKGFTLIELLVVIAIIGILSSVVLASLNSARGKARDARRLSDVKQIQTALELLYDSCGGYPSQATKAPLTAAAVGPTCPTGVTLGTYLPVIPVDPTATQAYNYCSASSEQPLTCAASTALYGIEFTTEAPSNAFANPSAGLHTVTPSRIF